MTYRQRLSATVRADLLRAGKSAVAEGRAPTLSAWVNDALARQAEHDRRLKALGDFIEAYEAKHGRITDEEIEAAERHMRARAVVTTPRGRARAAAKRRRGAA
jgi:hypothetical protein